MIFNDQNAPKSLKECFRFNIDLNKSYDLRNLNQLAMPQASSFNHFEDDTFKCFFSKFLNKFCINDLYFNRSIYEIRTKNNTNLFFIKFVDVFPKFDLNYKNFFFSFVPQTT